MPSINYYLWGIRSLKEDYSWASLKTSRALEEDFGDWAKRITLKSHGLDMQGWKFLVMGDDFLTEKGLRVKTSEGANGGTSGNWGWATFFHV